MRRTFMRVVIPAVIALGIGLGIATQLTKGAGTLTWRRNDCQVDGSAFLVRPEDLTELGEVIITTPKHPLAKESLQLQGLESGWEIAMALISPEPGEYAADIIGHLYEFSSPQDARAVLDQSFPPREEGWSNGSELLEDEVVESLNTCAVKWEIWHITDRYGLPIYSLALQSGPYIDDVYITIFSASFTDEIAVEGSALAEERKEEYIRTLIRKLEEGKSFSQIVNTERARSFGRRLINHILKIKLSTCQHR